jgi:hypothetical protein
MIAKPAQINQLGVGALERFGEDPSLIGCEDPEADQYYVLGISVPGVKLLEEPFNVPVVGDYESVSLGIDWPRMGNDRYLKRVTYTGMLPAEEITIGDPKETNPLIVDKHAQRVDEALDEYTGEWGAFLRATVEICEAANTDRLVRTGAAQFICIETEAEFDTIQHILKTRYASAGELVGSFLFARSNVLALE